MKDKKWEEINEEYQKSFEILRDKQQDVFKYLSDSFQAMISMVDKDNFTIYKLKFKDINIGIMLENDMLIEMSSEYNCHYAYDLVMGELHKIIIERYTNKEEK